jgi:hypothetical protein
MLSFHSLTRPHHAETVRQPAQASLARQAIVTGAADHAAAAHAAAAVAASVAAARAAHKAHVAHAAHTTHEAAVRATQGEAQQAAVQQPTTTAAVQQAPSGAPRQIAERLLARYGWPGQFSCLDALWAQESGWNASAENPSSGAYGIPQALPGSKMASAGPDWQFDAATQISWGLGYIQAVYGSPCAAWDHEEAVGWY